MPRIHPVQLQEAGNDVRKTLEGVKAKIGMVPNLYATFARSPAVFNAYLALNETLGEGQLSAAEREVVALAVGQANQCGYCLSAHTMIAKGAGLSAQQIEQARRADGSNALAAFAARIVERRGMITDNDVHAARASGLDDERIVEVVANVALNTLTNYLNHVADTEIDFPKVSTDL